MEHQRAKCEAATSRSMAYCAGYKWIVKGVLRSPGDGGGELSDADALDTVQLTQRLDREVAANHANRFQIQYLTSASELARVRTVRLHPLSPGPPAGLVAGASRPPAAAGDIASLRSGADRRLHWHVHRTLCARRNGHGPRRLGTGT